MPDIAEGAVTLINSINQQSPLSGPTGLPGGIGAALSQDSSLSGITNAVQAAQSGGGVFSAFGGAGPNRHVLFQMLSRGDPLLNFCWFVDMPIIGNINLPWGYVEECTAPIRSYGTKEQYRQGQTYKFAAAMSISDLNLRFYDDNSGKTQAYLEMWRTLVRGQKGIYNYPINYKKKITLTILDVSRFIKVYEFTFKGCWPMTAEPYNLSSGTSDRLIPSQEFSIDDMDLTVRGMTAGGLANAIFSSLGNFTAGFGDALNNAAGSIAATANGLFSSGNPVSEAAVSPYPDF